MDVISFLFRMDESWITFLLNVEQRVCVDFIFRTHFPPMSIPRHPQLASRGLQARNSHYCPLLLLLIKRALFPKAEFPLEHRSTLRPNRLIEGQVDHGWGAV